MSEPSTLELDRLREIGWAEWDPIGFGRSGCPSDEYDAYLLQVVARLRRGEAVEAAADYLENVRSELMGLGPSTPPSREAAARTVAIIKQFLDGLAAEGPKLS